MSTTGHAAEVALLPQSEDAEKALLSSFFIDPAETGRMCAERRTTKEHFHIPSNRLVFTCLLSRWAGEKPIDIITVTQALRDSGELEQCGGAAYVTELFTLLPTAANARNYAEILEEKLTLRRIIKICTEAGFRSMTEQDQLGDILTSVQSQIAGIGAFDSIRIQSMKENVREAVETLEGRMTGGVGVITTGLPALDVDLGPIERGNLLVIGGQTKAGKSMLAGQIALNLVLEDKPVLFISLEMTERELTLRMLASMARVDTRMVRVWTEAEHQRFFAAQNLLAKAPLTIATRLYKLSEIVGVSQRCAKRSGEPLAAIVLDYAQLAEGMKQSRDDRRQQEIAEISRMAKRLAGSLNVLFILLSQLNDDGRTREGRDLENDANIMVEVGHNRDTGERGVKVVLARSAPSGKRLKLRIIPEHTRVDDAPDVDVDEKPPAKPEKRKWHKD